MRHSTRPGRSVRFCSAARRSTARTRFTRGCSRLAPACRKTRRTGSAVAAFAGPLAAAKPGDGQHAYVVEQGYEMGRPSIINLTLDIRGGALASATVGGDAVLVTEGAIEA
jgi:trans-2,3-dihydro-3-hydroxyanthranilate isomerase